MRLWLARDHEVPIHEQLVTQVVLGIVSGELRPAQKLPSTRELARRFGVHSNTISAAYRQLARDKWLEFRRGSGVYVRRSLPESSLPVELEVDQRIAAVFRWAREGGTPLSLVRARLQRWLALQPPDHFLVVEPDPELRRIAVTEVRNAVTLPVDECGIEECADPERLTGAVPVVLPSKFDAVRRILPPGAECVALRVRSVPRSLGEWLPAPADALVAVASRWPGFLQSARTMLVAAGFDPDTLLLLDARTRTWSKRAQQAAAVVCDSVTATTVQHRRTIVFSLLAEESLAELRRYQEFIAMP